MNESLTTTPTDSLAHLSLEYPDLWVDCLEDIQRQYHVRGLRLARYILCALFGALIAKAIDHTSVVLIMAAATVSVIVLAPMWHRWRMQVAQDISLKSSQRLHPEMRPVREQMLLLASATKLPTTLLQIDVAHARRKLILSEHRESSDALY